MRLVLILLLLNGCSINKEVHVHAENVTVEIKNEIDVYRPGNGRTEP